MQLVKNNSGSEKTQKAKKTGASVPLKNMNVLTECHMLRELHVRHPGLLVLDTPPVESLPPQAPDGIACLFLATCAKNKPVPAQTDSLSSPDHAI